MKRTAVIIDHICRKQTKFPLIFQFSKQRMTLIHSVRETVNLETKHCHLIGREK